MEIRELKTTSLSNLILIILNNQNNDTLRRCAEVELKKRIKHVGWNYNDLLHFDDKVIKQRGLDIDNYLISPNVNMQQLMETFFMYDNDKDYYSNGLLFSEKHLCNQYDFGESFFRRICFKEIKNIDQRLNENESPKDYLIAIKQMLIERQQNAREENQEIRKEDFVELLRTNEAMYHIDEDMNSFLFLFNNLTDEELYKLLCSRLGKRIIELSKLLNNSLCDLDIIQYLYGQHFIHQDSAKLHKQKRKLLNEVKKGYKVDYQSDAIKKSLQ